jgi:hypothetical protein
MLLIWPGMLNHISKSHGKLKYLLKRALSMLFPNKLIQKEKKNGFYGSNIPMAEEIKDDVKKKLSELQFCIWSGIYKCRYIKTYIDFIMKTSQAAWEYMKTSLCLTKWAHFTRVVKL